LPVLEVVQQRGHWYRHLSSPEGTFQELQRNMDAAVAAGKIRARRPPLEFRADWPRLPPGHRPCSR
jgi:hypothetical protein